MKKEGREDVSAGLAGLSQDAPAAAAVAWEVQQSPHAAQHWHLRKVTPWHLQCAFKAVCEYKSLVSISVWQGEYQH